MPPQLPVQPESPGALVRGALVPAALAFLAAILLAVGPIPSAAQEAGKGAAGSAGGGSGGGTQAEIVYLAAPQAGDLRASDLIGAAVHAADDPLVEQVAGLAGNSQVGMLARALPKQKLGTVTDILLTGEGAVRAVLVDVGRLVGTTGKIVAVPIDAVGVAGEAGEGGGRILLLAATRDSLRAAPAYEGAGAGMKPLAMAPAGGMSAPTVDSRIPLAAAGSGTAVATAGGDGYRHAAMGEMTAKMLRNAEVYGSEGERIGRVRAVEETDSGIVMALIVEMGGLLGVGAHTVALPARDVTVLRRTDGSDLRLRANASRAQVQAMPRHRN